MPTIKPIIFSRDMVIALLDRRKTQTRRLITSPLRKTEPGTLLYVRESLVYQGAGGWRYKAGVGAVPGQPIDVPKPNGRTHIPSIHMPRAASRLTLRVTEVREQFLQEITEADAKAEGAMFYDGRGVGHSGWRHDYSDVYPTARHSFAALWSKLHTKLGERPQDNPKIVALSFEVIQKNVDDIA